MLALYQAQASLVAQMNLLAVQETAIWSQGQDDLLEKGMATHSSIIAWRFPWTEMPGRLQLWNHKESDALSHFHFHTGHCSHVTLTKNLQWWYNYRWNSRVTDSLSAFKPFYDFSTAFWLTFFIPNTAFQTFHMTSIFSSSTSLTIQVCY